MSITYVQNAQCRLHMFNIYAFRHITPYLWAKSGNKPVGRQKQRDTLSDFAEGVGMNYRRRLL